jgi:protein SCO1/2
MKRSILVLALTGAALLGVVVSIGVDRLRPGAAVSDVTLAHGTLLGAPRPLPAFALTAADGSAFSNAALRDRWSLLFFGFTHCPDVCPTTLATLAAARRELADLPATARPDVVLVSVDPARDTPAILSPYVKFFDASFRGVTGSSTAIDAFTRGLGVAVLRGSARADGSYDVSHTASIFVVDPAGRLVAVLSAPHTATGVAADFRRILAARQG